MSDNSKSLHYYYDQAESGDDNTEVSSSPQKPGVSKKQNRLLQTESFQQRAFALLQSLTSSYDAETCVENAEDFDSGRRKGKKQESSEDYEVEYTEVPLELSKEDGNAREMIEKFVEYLEKQLEYYLLNEVLPRSVSIERVLDILPHIHPDYEGDLLRSKDPYGNSSKYSKSEEWEFFHLYFDISFYEEFEFSAENPRRRYIGGRSVYCGNVIPKKENRGKEYRGSPGSYSIERMDDMKMLYNIGKKFSILASRKDSEYAKKIEEIKSQIEKFQDILSRMNNGEVFQIPVFFQNGDLTGKVHTNGQGLQLSHCESNYKLEDDYGNTLPPFPNFAYNGARFSVRPESFFRPKRYIGHETTATLERKLAERVDRRKSKNEHQTRQKKIEAWYDEEMKAYENGEYGEVSQVDFKQQIEYYRDLYSSFFQSTPENKEAFRENANMKLMKKGDFLKYLESLEKENPLAYSEMLADETEKLFLQKLKGTNKEVMGMYYEGKVVGFLLFESSKDDEEMNITYSFMDPDYRGMGGSTLMIERAIQLRRKNKNVKRVNVEVVSPFALKKWEQIIPHFQWKHESETFERSRAWYEPVEIKVVYNPKEEYIYALEAYERDAGELYFLEKEEAELAEKEAEWEAERAERKRLMDNILLAMFGE